MTAMQANSTSDPFVAGQPASTLDLEVNTLETAFKVDHDVLPVDIRKRPV